MCEECEGPRLWFRVQGRPRPMTRHRVRITGSDGSAGPKVVAFNTPQYKLARAAVREAAWLAMKQAGMEPWPGDVALDVEVLAAFAYPARTPKRERVDGQPMIGRPDVDNCAKLIMDALMGVAFQDDAQISAMTVIKQRAEPATDAGYYVTVRAAQP